MKLENFLSRFPSFENIYKMNKICKKQTSSFRETIYIIKHESKFDKDSYTFCCKMAFLGG